MTLSLSSAAAATAGRLPSDATRGQLAICKTRVEASLTVPWKPVAGLARAVLVNYKAAAGAIIEYVSKRTLAQQQ
jgi:hypothetical protein